MGTSILWTVVKTRCQAFPVSKLQLETTQVQTHSQSRPLKFLGYTCVMYLHRLKRSSVCNGHIRQVFELEFGKKVNVASQVHVQNSLPVELPINCNFSYLKSPDLGYIYICIYKPVLLVQSQRGQS